MADPMDKVLEWEDDLHAEGYRAGWERGLEEAQGEGVQMGAEAGCVAGMRVGYIRGYLQVVAQVQEKVLTTDRLRRSYAAACTALDAIDLDCLDEDAIRLAESRFSLLSHQLKLTPLGVSTASLLPASLQAPDLSF